MEWTEDGIVLTARKHGESAAIVTLLSRDHGRHAGLVRGGAGRRARGIYQPGNRVRAHWSARLAEHLGTFRCELLRAHAADHLHDPLRLLALADELDRGGLFTDTFMVSALNGDGVADLVPALAAVVPEGPWLYPADRLTDMNERLFAAEITREQLFLQLHQELPYALTVETEAWQERDDGSVRIEQVIYVEQKSQRGIVLGKGGRKAKSVGTASRKELERLLERRVHLFLFVKVRDKWRDDPERYRAIGLEFGE